MEPVNKTQTHQSENVSKANLNNANLLGCPRCGSRACVQTNCWKVFYPQFPRCRACLENEEDVTFPQPCFFNPQFLNPFFHNGSSIPQNYFCYCNHGDINKNQNSECSTKDQVNHECGKTRAMATPHVLCQKMKKKPVRDKISEKNNASDNESSYLPQCQNQAREPSHWNYQPCDCRESGLLWTSNPFVIPIVSYCVLWHPQNLKENCSNYSCGQMDNLNQKGEDAEGDSYSNSENNEKYDRDMDVENECVQDCSEDGMSKKETDREQNRSSSSFLSLHSSTHNGNKIYNMKKKNSSPSVNPESDANSEEEATEELQIRCSDSSSNSQNHLSVKSNENVLSNAGDSCDIYSAGNGSQRSSIAGSEYDTKAEDSSAEAEVEDQIECLDESSEETNIHNSRKSSLESLEEKNSEYNGADTELSNNNLKTKPKMFIKNFTVTNRTESAFQGTPKILAAGGDLGGDNCVGFKVNIDSEEMVLENSASDTVKQNFEMKQISLKVLEKKKPGSPIDKTTMDSKAPRGSRTGIARLIQDSKSKENTKSENKQPDYTDTKRRRFQVREEISKFQKDKSGGIALQQKFGPEKHNLTLNLNNRLPNKEKRFSAPKVRPHNYERNSRK